MKIAVIGGGLVGKIFVDYFSKRGYNVDHFLSNREDIISEFKRNDNQLIGDFILHENQKGTSKKWGKVLSIPNQEILFKYGIKLNEDQIFDFINEYFNFDKIYNYKSNDFQIHSIVSLKKTLRKADREIIKKVSKINISKNGCFVIDEKQYSNIIICTGCSTIPIKVQKNQLELKKPKIIYDKLIKLKNIDLNSFIDGSKLNKNGDLLSQDIPISVPNLTDKSFIRVAFYHMVLRSKLTSKNFIAFYFKNLFKCLKILMNIILFKRSFMYFSTYTLRDIYPVEINLEDKIIHNSLKDNEPKMLAYHFDARIEKNLNIKGIAYEHFTKEMKPIYYNPVGLRMLRILSQII